MATLVDWLRNDLVENISSVPERYTAWSSGEEKP